MTVDELENSIRCALLDFVNATGREIESVRVDTRNYANLDVEVFLKPQEDRVAPSPAGDKT